MLVCAGTFTVLILPWPGWRSSWAGVFRASAGALFALAPGHVAFEPGTSRRSERFDTVMTVSEAGGNGWRYHLSSRDVALLPSAAFLALFLASSFFARFEWKRCLAGLLAIQVYVLARVALLFLHGWTRHANEGTCPGNHPALLGRRAWRETIEVLAELDSDPTAYVLVPIVVWALVMAWGHASPGLSRAAAAESEA